MNWQKIKEDCPKVLQKLLDDKNWVMQEHTVCYNHEWDSFVSIRDLYDFFDEQDIVIVINYYSETGAFIAEIWVGGNNELDAPFKSRTEAETQAFIKAFEILENKLED
jgi:hypothetical protein